MDDGILKHYANFHRKVCSTETGDNHEERIDVFTVLSAEQGFVAGYNTPFLGPIYGECQSEECRQYKGEADQRRVRRSETKCITYANAGTSGQPMAAKARNHATPIAKHFRTIFPCSRCCRWPTL